MPIIFFFEVLAFLKVIKREWIRENGYSLLSYSEVYFWHSTLVFETYAEVTKIFCSQ
jgi:hypothetical protein